MAAFLITGRPGVGKTTLVRDVVGAIDRPASGFYTEERRDISGHRTGFDLVNLDGTRVQLAGIDIRSDHRVGRYGVNEDTVRNIGVPAIAEGIEKGRLVVIDEIGKMELLVPEFQRAVIEAFRRGSLLLATIMLAPHPFADEIKAQRDAQLFEIDEQNHDDVRGLIEAQLRAATGQFSV